MRHEESYQPPDDSSLLIHKNHWDRWGGAEETRAEMIRSYGFSNIFLLSSDVPAARRVSEEAYTWLPLEMSKILGREVLSPQRVAAINKELLAANPSVLVFDQPTSIIDLLLLSRLDPTLKQKAVIFWGNDVLEIGKDRPYLFRSAKNRAIARVANGFALNLGESDQVLNSLEKIGVNSESLRKILVPIIKPEANVRMSERVEYLDANQIGVLFASRLAFEKNLQILPQFLESLQKRLEQLDRKKLESFTRVGVTLVGPEQDPEILQMVEDCAARFMRKLRGKVTFTYHGMKNPETMHMVYAHHSFVVMPARTEGFGRVTIEAMNYGAIPIINRECGASVEVAGKVGLPASDSNFAEEAALYVIGAMMQTKGVQQTSQAAIKRAELFTVEHAKNRFIRVLQEAGLL